MPDTTTVGRGPQFGDTAGVEKAKCGDSNVGKALSEWIPGGSTVFTDKDTDIRAHIYGTAAARINDDGISGRIRKSIGDVRPAHSCIRRLENVAGWTTRESHDGQIGRISGRIGGINGDA